MKRSITGWVVCALAGAYLLSGQARASDIATIEGMSSGTLVVLDSNPVVSAILNHNGTNWSFLVNDGTGSLAVFGTLPGSYTPTVGDILTVSGKYSPYHQIPEIGTVTAISVVSSGNPVPSPISKTIPEVNLVTLPMDVAGHYITLSSVTIQTSSGGTPTGTFPTTNTEYKITDGTNTMVLYYWPGSYSVSRDNLAGKPIPTWPVNMTGIVSVYNSTPEFTPITIESAPGTFAVGGTSSPSPVLAGGTLNLSATVNPGTNPDSSGVTVTADLTALGGPAAAAFTETPVGSLNFTYSLVLPCTVGAADYALTLHAADLQLRSASTHVAVTVQAGSPAITVQPSNNIVCAGGTAQFTVVATGSGLSYRWYNAAGPLNDGGNISGTAQASMQISNVSQADVDAGPYYVIVTGTCPIAGDPPVYTETSNTAALALGTAATADQKQVVISQVYGGGGNSGAYWTNDFIELFNRGTTPVVLDGWSVQYASADLVSGGSPSFEAPPRITVLTGTIQPGHYFLIQEAVGAGGQHALPQPPDFDGTSQNNGIAISATAGKVALVNNSAPLSTTCPLTNCGVVDFLGWDPLYTTCFEGTGAAPYTGNTSAVFRKTACQDTDDNAADFAYGTILEGSVARPHVSTDTAAPLIVTQPVDQRVCANLTATFTVTADGPCLSYQWQVKTGGNWADVTTGTGGNTRSYTTAAIAVGDDGTEYRVVVSNPFGSPATSDSATVAIEVVSDTDRQIVINQVYGGGGNTGAVYQNDFIELYNKGTTPVDVTGWSVQYASAAGTSWSNKTDLSGVIQPGHYYLIKEAAGSSCDSLPCGAPLPGMPDATGSINLSATNGKVVLLKSTIALDGIACPDADCRTVDLVGFGTANCFEGANPAPAPSNTQSISRTPVGTDTGENGVDFIVGAPTPTHNAPGDFNGDGFVNSDDIGLFAACVTGPRVDAIATGCSDKDLDTDGDVDLSDFGLLQRCFRGADPADRGCLSGM